MRRHGFGRAALLQAAAVALAAASVGVLLFGIRPAWEERSRLSAQLDELEQMLEDRAQLTVVLPDAEARLEEARRAVCEGEERLAPAGGDAAVLRQLEDLAGAEVSVTELVAGEPVPVAPAAAGGGASDAGPDAAPPEGAAASRYWQLPLQVKAAGDPAALVEYLRKLEGEVVGLRVRSVVWQGAQQPYGSWQLSVTGALYMVSESD